MTLRETLIRQFGNWWRALRLIWAASSFYTSGWAVLLILQGLLPGSLVYLTKLVVDSLIIAVNHPGDWANIRPAIFYIAAAAAVMLISEVFQSLLEMVRTAQADIIQDYIKGLVHTKSESVDMADFESAEYQDRLEQATSDGANSPLSLLESVGGVLQNTITLLVMAGLLFQYSTWLPIVLLVSTLPVFFIILRFDREYHKWWTGTTGDRRWIHYFDMMLTHSLAVAEMRVFNLNPHFQSKYQSLRKKLRSDKLDQMRRLGIAKILSSVLSLGILGAALGWMGFRALAGYLTLGDLALFYQAFNRGQGLVNSLLGSLSKVIKNSMYLTVLFEFLDLEPSIVNPGEPVGTPVSLKTGIRISDLTFRYPGSSRPVFENFSLFIPAGKSIAIVGENGSGKTTLLKLLCRFYDPESGSIEMDDIDVRKYSVRDLLRMITILFQVPLIFHATIRETIELGDLEAGGSVEAVETAARGAGAHDFISRFPSTYDTMIGKVYPGGVELSGGERQRLALARAYYRKAPIVLLDEPTSFMDSWSEADWFQRFRKLTKGRTAVVITHRFTIAMQADIIHVMSKGEIIESGTHKELLRMNGFYARSWKQQMQSAEDFKFENSPSFAST